MRNFISILFLVCTAFCMSACTNYNTGSNQIPNPWVDCNQNMKLAQKTAGFGFPVDLKNYKIRAMKDMIEVTYMIDTNREVTIRKSAENVKTDENGLADISGDYNVYPVTETIRLNGEVPFLIRRDNDKIYVANFSAEAGLYSMQCPQGLSLDEIEKIYEIIADADAPK